VLRTHLLDEQPDLAPALHRRASEWYAGNGQPSEAIRHALAACDFGTAADLVELAASTMLRTRQEATLLGWLKDLPEEVLSDRPVLSDIYAGPCCRLATTTALRLVCATPNSG
jgi:LuxR family maltose regulon positive regulatory protein